jgi:hypothetical protein
MGAHFHVVFVEHAFSDGIGRPVEPALGHGFALAPRTPQLRDIAFYVDGIDTDGNIRSRPDVGASLLSAATSQRRAEDKVRVVHGAANPLHSRSAMRIIIALPGSNGRSSNPKRL